MPQPDGLFDARAWPGLCMKSGPGLYRGQSRCRKGGPALNPMGSHTLGALASNCNSPLGLGSSEVRVPTRPVASEPGTLGHGVARRSHASPSVLAVQRDGLTLTAAPSMR